VSRSERENESLDGQEDSLSDKEKASLEEDGVNGAEPAEEEELDEEERIFTRVDPFLDKVEALLTREFARQRERMQLGDTSTDDEDKEVLEEELLNEDLEEVATAEDSPAGKGRQTSRDKPQNKTFPTRFEVHPVDSRPPFHEIVDAETGNVKADVSSLLHFAIVGFGKCGSTSAMKWLNQHPDLQCFPREVYDLYHNSPAQFLYKLYSLPSRQAVEGPDAPTDWLRGYKSPLDLHSRRSHAVNLLGEMFPKTKIIVGIRHPVRWFESLFNFRIQNSKEPEKFPHPNELVGLCTPAKKNTCTYKGEFSVFLRSLGKTLPVNLLDEEGEVDDSDVITPFEAAMYKAAKIRRPRRLRRLPNPVFLFEVSQLKDGNATRAERFSRDMQAFLELKTPMPEIPHEIPGRQHDDEERQRIRDALKIDICDDEYIPLRKVLMRISRMTATWIRDYFLPVALTDESVVISSPDYFAQIMDRWMEDPCGGDATEWSGRYMVRGNWSVQSLEAFAMNQKTARR
jgi:hypothetical protein